MKYAQLYLLIFVNTSAYSMDGLRLHQQHGVLFYSDKYSQDVFNQQDIGVKTELLRHKVVEQIQLLPAQLFGYVGTMHETECWPLERNWWVLRHPTIESLQTKVNVKYSNGWRFLSAKITGKGLSQELVPYSVAEEITGIQWDPEEPYTLYVQYGYQHGQVDKYVYDRALLEHYFSQDATYAQMVMVYALLRYRLDAHPTYVQDAIDKMNEKLSPKNPITDPTEWINTQKTLPRYASTALNRALCLKMRRN